MKLRFLKDNTFKTGFTIAVAFIICLFIINIGRASADTRQAEEKKETSAVVYIVKNHEGWIGIFEDGVNVPIKILNVRVTSLPESDARALNEGIRLESRDELLQIIEDYSS